MNPHLDATVTIRGVRVPRFLYGTAWKEGETRRLTALAIERGFRGIDTANQRKHYCEAEVGAGVADCIARGLVRREDLFLQTKYTFQRGQDHRLPYDPAAPIARQVEQSVASSLEHLGTATVDSYVLHGPSQRPGLGKADREAWQAMEAACEAGRVRLLGVSNVSAEQLRAFCAAGRVRPAFVQNRCYASQGWDRAVREVCREHDVAYQGFSLLTANGAALGAARLRRIAEAHGRSPAQVVFRFALAVGMVPLTGTTDPSHMDEDLQALGFDLSADEVGAIESLGG